MMKPVRITGIVLWFAMFALPSLGIAQAPTDEESLRQGEQIYLEACKWCHGSTGKGDGPAALFNGAYSAPRPRDFTGEESFKLRSTPSGEFPTDEDLFRTITNGIPAYMPSFAGLSSVERWQVVAYIKSLNPDFVEASATSLTLPLPSVPSSPESIRRGQEIFHRFECDSCHGINGQGESELYQAGELRDGRDLPIRPTDLTMPSSFKHGHQPRDIAMSILTGLDGTPMPGFAHMFEDSPEDLWHLVNYILSLSNERVWDKW